MVMSYSQGETAAPWAWMLQAKGMLHVTAPGTPPRPRPGFPHACSSEGTAVLPPSCFPPIPVELRVGGFVWHLGDSFSQKTTINTARPLVSSEWFSFSDIWPTFPSKWALWMLKSYSGNSQEEGVGSCKGHRGKLQLLSREWSRGLKKTWRGALLVLTLTSHWQR